MKDFGSVLETARRAAGLTQTELAERSGLTQAAIHRYEKASRLPNPETLARLASTLGLTTEFFEHAGRVEGAMAVEEVELSTTHRFSTFDPLDVGAADAARLVRMQWRMPVGPVRTLTQWLESSGCLILEENFGTPRVDGLSPTT